LFPEAPRSFQVINLEPEGQFAVASTVTLESDLVRVDRHAEYVAEEPWEVAALATTTTLPASATAPTMTLTLRNTVNADRILERALVENGSARW
jgi:hypothetical protein